MKTREEWQRETKVIRDMAKGIWDTSGQGIIPKTYHVPNGELDYARGHGEQFNYFKKLLLGIRDEMIEAARDRDLEDEDYLTIEK